MKTLEKKIAVMQAYADGKKIECKGKLREDGWEDCLDPVWDWSCCDYRIKPETKYRPYANADECFADVLKHSGWAKEIKIGVYFAIAGIGKQGCFISERFSSYQELFADYVWADDGTPCGVLEE